MIELPLTELGLFSTVVIDPPWPMQKIQTRNRPNQVDMDYDTMSIQEIQSIPISDILEKDSYVLMWTTQRFLFDAINIIDYWGLKYGYLITWLKNQGNPIFNGPKYTTEFVVVSKQGNPRLISQKGLLTGFSAPSIGHSIKPQIFYDTIARCFPPDRLDMFNRRKIPGFTGWGLESPDIKGVI